MKNLFYLLFSFFLFSCTATKKPVNKAPEAVLLKIATDSGDMVVKLYNKTPLHRDNFLKLVKSHFYDSLLFHRVVNHFMIQAGDPNSKNAPPGILLGEGGLNYTIPAEFDTSLFHKKGALAAAREGGAANPEKASSSTQFYIVDGRAYTDAQLDQVEARFKITIPENHRKVYRTIGGAPHLDMNYTVFGEVISGLDVIDKIAGAQTDENNRPLKNIEMTITIIK